VIAVALLIAAAAADPVSGTWHGTSLCQVKPSPCHDEQVIYEVRFTRPHRYRIDAYKLVAGQRDFMGAIDVTLDAAGTHLDGPVMSHGQARGRLQLTVAGSHMSGRMITSDGTLYRLIEIDRH
jgi:hypothetical protein